jgi:cytochrome o ubiquinol oxidase subunit 3
MIEEPILQAHVTYKNEELEKDAKASFGFWVYLMTDCVLFASLFAVYAVLRKNTFGGPDGAALFSLPYVLTETFILLTSSFTSGLGSLAARRGDRRAVLQWFGATFVLGIAFLCMELSEFSRLDHAGHSWRASGFLSGYFTLVGTHGLHISIGLIWMAVLLVVVFRKGLKPSNVRKLTLLATFWHFLDLIWIFIFTIVYLLGVVQR